MQYEAPPRRSSTGTVIVVVFLLGFMFLIGLAVAGLAVLVFARARRTQARATRATRRGHASGRGSAGARRTAAEGRRKQIRPTGRVGSSRRPCEGPRGGCGSETAETAGDKGSLRVADREITIQLDEGGKIQVDGTACELPQLKEMLEKAGQGREHDIIVIVKADKRCLFEPVAGVLAVCKELDLPHVRIAALGEGIGFKRTAKIGSLSH